MRGRSIERRVERLEKLVRTESKFSGKCICFPEKEYPDVGCPVELEIAARVKCPLHGERFKPRFFVFVAQWRREKIWSLLWSHHSEQYRKAWFASFPPDLWPAVEVGNSDGNFLKLKDGTLILVGRRRDCTGPEGGRTNESSDASA